MSLLFETAEHLDRHFFNGTNHNKQKFNYYDFSKKSKKYLVYNIN